MKIVFTELPTSGGKIQVSFDGGSTFKDYNVAEIKVSGIPLDDNQDYEKIQIKGSSNVLKNLDVISKINTHSDDDLLPEDITGIVLKDFNGKFDKSLLQKYPKLTSVTIPESVTTIGYGAFSHCTSLTSLTSITIPEGVNSISDCTFYSCKSLTSITIPDSVKTIGNRAFYDCTSLTSITIPSSVTSITKGAFEDCRSLRTINYKGTEEQWNAISKGNWWNTNCPKDMVINYNYQG